MELFAGVADVLPDGVNADEQSAGNVAGAVALREQAEYLNLPTCEGFQLQYISPGFVGMSLMEHVNQKDLIRIICGDERDQSNSLSRTRGALQSHVRYGRNLPKFGGGYGRAVSIAEWGRAVDGESLQDLIALPADDLLRLVSKNSLGFRVPGYDRLAEVDGKGSIWGGFESVYNVHVLFTVQELQKGLLDVEPGPAKAGGPAPTATANFSLEEGLS